MKRTNGGRARKGARKTTRSSGKPAKRASAVRRKSSRSVVRDDGAGEERNADLYAAADAMYRCAVESCHQHHRVAQLVAASATDTEQQVAWQVATLCDALLREVTEAYAPVAAQASEKSNSDLRRSCNALWRASRAFAHRFLDRDGATHDAGEEHSSGDFLGLRLRHELDASAILNLKHAAEAYSRLRRSKTMK